MDLIIRPEAAADRAVIHWIHRAAFARLAEAELVDNLRRDGAVLLSLVAEIDRQIVGNVLFSRMWIENAAGSIPAVALAPVAVLPDSQRRGIGSRLIREGLNQLRKREERIVLVLGDPAYYPRFGFSAEKAHALETPFPPEAFMALELCPGALTGILGKVRYPAAFGL